MASIRSFNVLAAASLAVALSSCVESENPLSDPDRSVPDPEIYGTWVRQNGGFTEILMIGRAGEVTQYKDDVPAGLMRSISIATGSEGFVAESENNTFFVSTFRRDRYLNIIPYPGGDVFDRSGNKKVWDKHRIRSYVLQKYQVTADKLTVWSGDQKIVARVIEGGTLKGTVTRDQDKRDKPVTSARLTDTTAHLAKYIENGGGAVLFPDSKKIEYVRLTPVRTLETRQWLSDDGRFKVEAVLIKFDGQVARLKRLDGATIDVPLARLSFPDRKFLETHKDR